MKKLNKKTNGDEDSLEPDYFHIPGWSILFVENETLSDLIVENWNCRRILISSGFQHFLIIYRLHYSE